MAIPQNQHISHFIHQPNMPREKMFTPYSDIFFYFILNLPTDFASILIDERIFRKKKYKSAGLQFLKQIKFSIYMAYFKAKTTTTTVICKAIIGFEEKPYL